MIISSEYVNNINHYLLKYISLNLEILVVSSIYVQLDSKLIYGYDVWFGSSPHLFAFLTKKTII